MELSADRRLLRGPATHDLLSRTDQPPPATTGLSVYLLSVVVSCNCDFLGRENRGFPENIPILPNRHSPHNRQNCHIRHNWYNRHNRWNCQYHYDPHNRHNPHIPTFRGNRQFTQFTQTPYAANLPYFTQTAQANVRRKVIRRAGTSRKASLS